MIVLANILVYVLFKFVYYRKIGIFYSASVFIMRFYWYSLGMRVSLDSDKAPAYFLGWLSYSFFKSIFQEFSLLDFVHSDHLMATFYKRNPILRGRNSKRDWKGLSHTGGFPYSGIPCCGVWKLKKLGRKVRTNTYCPILKGFPFSRVPYSGVWVYCIRQLVVLDIFLCPPIISLSLLLTRSLSLLLTRSLSRSLTRSLSLSLFLSLSFSHSLSLTLFLSLSLSFSHSL